MKNDVLPRADFTFKKAERLSRRKLIEELFKSGVSFSLYPFRIQYLYQEFESAAPVQMLISVPSKKFKKAVDRNRIKRITREAYRLNKTSLYQALQMRNRKLRVAFIYTGTKLESFPVVNESVMKVIEHLIRHISAAENNK